MPPLSSVKKPGHAAKACVLALLLSLLLFTIALPPASHATRQSSGISSGKRKRPRAEYVPGQLLVRYRSEALAKSHERMASAAPLSLEGGEIAISVERFGGSELVEGLRRARVAPEHTLKAIEALKARPDVLYAEPVYVRHKDALPNDPRFGEMWGLRNTGQVGGTAGADIHAEQAWNITTGSSNVVVGVVDEGIDINHPDLKDNIWINPAPGSITDDSGKPFQNDINGWNFFDNNSTVFGGASGANGYPIDQTDSHGTHVAGTIGAAGNNGVGVTGINWSVKLMSLKFFGPDNRSNTGDEIKAFNYARKMRQLWDSSGGSKGANVRVLNNSYGGGGFSQAELDAINALNAAGILFVAAAGNDSSDNDGLGHYPSNYDAPNVISVAATNRFDSLAGFSSYGAHTVHLAAPGVSILSTTPNSTYDTFSGTSMATPHVSGAAALICAKYPDISVQKLRSVLIFNGDSLASLANRTLTGFRLNVFKSLQVAGSNDTTPPGTVGNFRISSQSGRTVTLAWTASGDDGATGRASLYEINFTDQVTGKQMLLTRVIPETSGAPQSVTVNIPFRHTAGTVTLREFDKVGNEGVAASTGISINPAGLADPYVSSLGAASALSTGGAPLGLTFDDRYEENYPLPFAFPFFGQTQNSVTISTNGALYFSTPPKRDNGDADDAGSSTYDLGHFKMVAGMWDDLTLETRLRADADVYVVTPDANRIIFRWQGVPCHDPGTQVCAGGDPVNFEIELRRDGTILTRYGSGNTGLQPVVGISGGEPDPYVIDALTSNGSDVNLTNAQTVTFALRPTTNPIDDARTFVTQHYLDFLNRQPDQGGLDYWTGQLTACGSDQNCMLARRVTVSAAYFTSTEFQQTGYYIYRFYKAGLGRQPLFAEFMADRSQVVGGADLEADKTKFADRFVTRAAFMQQYPVSLTAARYVDMLNTNSGMSLTLVERDGLVSGLTNQTETRASVLRKVADNQAFQQKEYNAAFVLMQYFGYLRRDPDAGGYQFWLGVMNGLDKSAFKGMTCAFITSAEYQLRFGSAVTHTNRDCGQ